MISKKDLLVRMGIYMSYDNLLLLVEKDILNAADKGYRKLEYTIPEKVSKEMVDQIFIDLIPLGYNVTTKDGIDNDLTYYSAGKVIVISW